MSQLENCIRGLLGRSVALNLTNRLTKKPPELSTREVKNPWEEVFLVDANCIK